MIKYSQTGGLGYLSAKQRFLHLAPAKLCRNSMPMATHLCSCAPPPTKVTNSSLSPLLNYHTHAPKHLSFLVRTPSHFSTHSRPSVSASAATTSIEVKDSANSVRPSKSLPFRVGHGFDLHRLEPGYPLIIGGINIPHDRGCEAHSDGNF